MTRPFLICVVFSMLTFIGCTEEDNKVTSYPDRPTEQMLAAGPEAGKEFLKWNSTGISRGAPQNYAASGYCFPGIDTDISIPYMIGLHVPPAANPNDTLYCTLTVEDTGYTITDYAPDGLDWSDSVVYWIDTSCVTIPTGSTATDIAFYWYRASDGTFEEVPTALLENVWKAKSLHFSRYILGQKRRIG